MNEELNAQLLASSLMLSVHCANALAEAGLLGPQRLRRCATQMEDAAHALEKANLSRGGVEPPSDRAAQLLAFARHFQDRADRMERK